MRNIYLFTMGFYEHIFGLYKCTKSFLQHLIIMEIGPKRYLNKLFSLKCIKLKCIEFFQIIIVFRLVVLFSNISNFVIKTYSTFKFYLFY